MKVTIAELLGRKEAKKVTLTNSLWEKLTDLVSRKQYAFPVIGLCAMRIWKCLSICRMDSTSLT